MRVVRPVSIVVLLLLTALAGCGGDRDDGKRGNETAPLDGTYVGKVDGTGAFVAVVVSPAGRDQKGRATTVYVCDGKRVCEWFSGVAKGKGFRVGADDGDGEATGELTRKSASGAIELSAGKDPPLRGRSGHRGRRPVRPEGVLGRRAQRRLGGRRGCPGQVDDSEAG